MELEPIYKLTLHTQNIWKDLFKVSSSNFGTMGHLFLRIGRLPRAKKTFTPLWMPS